MNDVGLCDSGSVERVRRREMSWEDSGPGKEVEREWVRVERLGMVVGWWVKVMEYESASFRRKGSDAVRRVSFMRIYSDKNE